MSKIEDLNRLRKLSGVKLLTPAEVHMIQEQEQATEEVVELAESEVILAERMNEKRKMFKIAGIPITEDKLQELCEVKKEETSKSECGCDKCSECDGCTCSEKDCKSCKDCTMCSCSEEDEEENEESASCDTCNCDPCTCEEEDCEMTK